MSPQFIGRLATRSAAKTPECLYLGHSSILHTIYLFFLLLPFLASSHQRRATSHEYIPHHFNDCLSLFNVKSSGLSRRSFNEGGSFSLWRSSRRRPSRSRVAPAKPRHLQKLPPALPDSTGEIRVTSDERRTRRGDIEKK